MCFTRLVTSGLCSVFSVCTSRIWSCDLGSNVKIFDHFEARIKETMHRQHGKHRHHPQGYETALHNRWQQHLRWLQEKRRCVFTSRWESWLKIIIILMFTLIITIASQQKVLPMPPPNCSEDLSYKQTYNNQPPWGVCISKRTHRGKCKTRWKQGKAKARRSSCS